MHSLTPSGTFGFYAAICFFGWVLLVFFYPEVSGLTIDETSQVFDQPLTKMVKFARERRAERIAANTLVARSQEMTIGH